MRLWCAAVVPALPGLLMTMAVTAAEAPFTALPYTPGLDTAAMDRSVDPCVDFHAYSCGSWQKHNPIPPDRAAWDVYGKLQAENLQYLWGLLEAAARPDAARTPAQQKIGDHFAACMDLAAVETRGFAPLRADLDAIDALRSRNELPALLARLHATGSNGGLLFGLTSVQDYTDAEAVIAGLFPGGLGLPDRDYYLGDEPRLQAARAEYERHIVRMLVLLGDPPASAAVQAAAILRFETDLARMTLTRLEQRDPHKTHHRVSRIELERLTPGFDWRRYLLATGAGRVSTFDLTDRGYFRSLGRLLATVPLPTLRSYLRWQQLNGSADLLSQAFVDQDFAFYRHYLRGIKQPPPRWKTCVAQVDANLGDALGQVFVANTFTPATRDAVVAMVEGIEKVMGERIRTLSWMSEPTKTRALAKLASMRNKIGYPERWRDYGALTIRRDDYFGNVRRSATFEYRRELAKIGQPLDRSEWGVTPPTVNAFYYQQMNDMNFPAGVLQPPLFDLRIDAAPGWGNTGQTIGHELTHGFDDEGRQYDADGNLRDWWTKEDAAAFAERAQCIVDQYAGYTVVDDLKINSRLTLGEDLADLGGTVLAYIGWKAATAGQALPTIDGLTPEQRFFIGFAQWACGQVTDEQARIFAATDPHSPLRHRVNGVVVNMPEFAQAFQCKAGQPMVKPPEKICRIW